MAQSDDKTRATFAEAAATPGVGSMSADCSA